MELVFTLGKLEIVLNLGILTGAVSGILLKALIVGLLTSVCAAVLGVPLVLKRYSMIGDGLSHMGFCALAIAAALGVPENKETLVTMPLIVAAAVVLLLLSEKGKLKGDAAIAMLSTGAVGLGYIIYRFAGRVLLPFRLLHHGVGKQRCVVQLYIGGGRDRCVRAAVSPDFLSDL